MSEEESVRDNLNKTVSEIDDMDSDTVNYAFEAAGVNVTEVSNVNVTEWEQSSAPVQQLTELNSLQNINPVESIKERWDRLQLHIIQESLGPSSNSEYDDSDDSDYVPDGEMPIRVSHLSKSRKRPVTAAAVPVLNMQADEAAKRCVEDVIDAVHESRPIINPRARVKFGSIQAHNQDLRLHGKPYFSVAVKCEGHYSVKNADGFCYCQYRRGREVPTPANSYKCRCNCNRLDHAHRLQLHELFYKRDSVKEQNDYLCSLVQEITVEPKHYEQSKRVRTLRRLYHLPSENPEATEPVAVCMAYFLATFDIDKDRIILCMQNKQVDGTFEPPKTNGSGGKKRKELSDKIRQPVREFIQSLPAQKPHYSRTQGCLKDAYVDLEGVYRLKHLYSIFKNARIAAGDTQFASRSTFDLVFRTEYHIGIARPVKDKCNTCTKFRHVEIVDEVILALQDKHLLRAKQAQHCKREDKELARRDPSVAAFTFDLQSVLYTPFTDDSVMFYCRKLAFYNLTIWNQVTKDVQCYLWSEVDGNRGSNEVGTCIYEKIMALGEEVKHVIFYSDTCAGQNRNRQLISLMINVLESTNLESITQKFMESGHSEMEVDSAHSCIERKRRKARIFGREGWRLILETARQDQPFETIDMFYNNFYDLKDLLNQYQFKDNIVDTSGSKMMIQQVKQLRFKKVNESIVVSFNYGFDDIEFRDVDFQKSTKRSTKKCPVLQSKLLKKTYVGQFPISSKKKNDLVGLVEKGLIPPSSCDFYLNLPSSDAVEDRLSRPASEEVTEAEY